MARMFGFVMGNETLAKLAAGAWLGGKGPLSLARVELAGTVASVAGCDGSAAAELRDEASGPEGSGAVCVDGGLLARMARALPEGAARVETDGKKLSIEGARGTAFRLGCWDAAAFQTVAGPKGGGDGWLSDEGGVLAEALRRTAWAAAREGRLAGVLLALSEGTLTAAATDGRALAEWRGGVKASGGAFALAVPARAAARMAEAMAEGGTVTLRADGRSLRACGEGWMVTALALEGKYPDYGRVFAETDLEAGLAPGEWLEALGRARLGCDGEGRTRLRVKGGIARFAARRGAGDAYAGAGAEAAAETGDGVELEKDVNGPLLAAALRAAGARARLAWRGDGAGALMIGDGAGWRAAVMPFVG